MKAKNDHFGLNVGFLTTLSALVALGSCSTTQVTPDPAPAPVPTVATPQYLKIPHPQGTDLGDLRAILTDPSVPAAADLARCEKDLKKLWKATQNDDERREGVKELIRKDASYYHWCFYSRISQLDDDLKRLNYIDQKQKRVIETYEFVVPVARAFSQEYHDSRYLRWAIVQYKRLSSWIFFRKLELTPEQTSELAQISNPFGLWREPAATTSVLEKYGIVEEPKSPGVMLPPGLTEATKESLPAPDPATATAPTQEAPIPAVE